MYLGRYEDPLFTLQYLARLAVQYDLADTTALLTVHSVVSFFVWRDGYFSLQNTKILILPCHLQWVWLRCAILVLVKPLAASLARVILKRAMRKTLLGKRTIHGISAIVTKQIQRQQYAKVGRGLRQKSFGALGHLARDAKMDLVEEELVALRDELSVSGLDFAVLFPKVMKKYKFFASVVLLQLFGVFQVYVKAPTDLAAASAHNASASATPHVTWLPAQSVWMHLEPRVAYCIDEQLRDVYTPQMATLSRGCLVDGFPAD